MTNNINVDIRQPGTELDSGYYNVESHNWDTVRDIIRTRGVDILSDAAFLDWLDENGIKHREEVQSFSDLPSNDSLNTVRGVFDDNKIYIKKGSGWLPFQTIDISKINEVENKVDEISTNSNDFINLQSAIDSTPENGTLLLKHNEEYNFTNQANINKNITIDGRGSTLNFNSANGIVGSGKLKSTKSTTASYNKGDFKITLNNTTGIEVGDLLNIVSSQLYDTGRMYYFKGGNVLVTKISGNDVLISMPLPFDMSYTSMVVRVYKPITVKLRNFKIKGTSGLAENKFGIRVSYGSNCVFEDVEAEGFQQNISYVRLVNTENKRVATGTSKTKASDPWDGYGLAMFSCTNTSFYKCTTKSGQHGLTWGGEEVNFGIKIEDSSIDSEVSAFSLGQHENVYDVRIIDSTIYGFSLAGNVIMENCDIQVNENNTTNRTNILSSAENTRNANYKFVNCRFNDMFVFTADYTQVSAPTRKYIGNITFDNCTGVRGIRTNINLQTAGGKIGEVTDLIIRGTNEITCTLYDNVKNVYFENSNFKGSGQLISQPTHSPQGKVKSLTLQNVELDKNFRGVNIVNTEKITMNNIRLSNVDDGNSTFNIDNAEQLSVENSDLSSFTRGMTLSNIKKLNVKDSSIKFYTGLAGASALQACDEAFCSGLNDTIKNCDVFTTPNKTKYIHTFKDDGTFNNTAVS